MKHVLESEAARRFFKDNGIVIKQESCHNVLHLQDCRGTEIALWAESEHTVAAGIPGLYVENEK